MTENEKAKVAGLRMSKSLVRRLRAYVGQRRLDESGEDIAPREMTQYTQVIEEALDAFLTERGA